jgi:hypothetical protein
MSFSFKIGDFYANEGTSIDASDSDLVAHLLTIPGVTSEFNDDGEQRFYASTPQTAHIVKLVENQRIPTKTRPFFTPRGPSRQQRPYQRPTSAALARTPFTANRQFSHQERSLRPSRPRWFDRDDNRTPVRPERPSGCLKLRDTNTVSTPVARPRSSLPVAQFSGDVRQKDAAVTGIPVPVAHYSGDVREKDAVQGQKRFSGDVREKDAMEVEAVARDSGDVRGNSNSPRSHAPTTSRRTPENCVVTTTRESPTELGVGLTPIKKTYEYMQHLEEYRSLQAHRTLAQTPQGVPAPPKPSTAVAERPNPYANSLFTPRAKKPVSERLPAEEPAMTRPEPKRTYKNTTLAVRKKTMTMVSSFRPIEPPHVHKEQRRTGENSLWTPRPPSTYDGLLASVTPKARDPRFGSTTTPPALISPPLVEQGGDTVPPPMSIKTEVIDAAALNAGALQTYRHKNPQESAVDNFLKYHKTVHILRPNKLNQVIVERIVEMEDPRKKVVAVRSTTGLLREPFLLLKAKFGFPSLEMLSAEKPEYDNWKVKEKHEVTEKSLLKFFIFVFQYNSFLCQHEIIGDDFFLAMLKEDHSRICIPGNFEQILRVINRQKGEDRKQIWHTLKVI